MLTPFSLLPVARRHVTSFDLLRSAILHRDIVSRIVHSVSPVRQSLSFRAASKMPLGEGESPLTRGQCDVAGRAVRSAEFALDFRLRRNVLDLDAQRRILRAVALFVTEVGSVEEL